MKDRYFVNILLSIEGEVTSKSLTGTFREPVFNSVKYVRKLSRTDRPTGIKFKLY